MAIEISGGEIAVKQEKPIEFPNPGEMGKKIKEKIFQIGNLFLGEKKKAERQGRSLSLRIASFGDLTKQGNWDEDKRRQLVEIADIFSSLGKEKPAFTKRVLQEVLPARRKKLAGDLDRLLHGQIPPDKSAEEVIAYVLDKFDFSDNQKRTIQGLSTLFAGIVSDKGGERSGGKLDWDRIIGRTPNRGDKYKQNKYKNNKKEKKERSKKEAKKEDSGPRESRILSQRRGAWFWPTVGAVLFLSALTYTEKDSSIKVSPVSYFLETKVGRTIPIIGRQPAEEKFFMEPEAQKAIEGRPEFNINDWLRVLFLKKENREHGNRPWELDKKNQRRISILEKKLGVPPDQIAEKGMSGVYYKNHPEFRLAWQMVEEIVKAKKTKKPIPQEFYENFIDIYWQGALKLEW